MRLTQKSKVVIIKCIFTTLISSFKKKLVCFFDTFEASDRLTHLTTVLQLLTLLRLLEILSLLTPLTLYVHLSLLTLRKLLMPLTLFKLLPLLVLTFGTSINFYILKILHHGHDTFGTYFCHF